MVSDKTDNLQEDVVAQRVGLLEEVEDCAESVGGEGEAVGRGGGDRLQEVAADSGQELLRLLGLENEVDEEVVGGSELLLGHRVEKDGILDDDIKSLFALLLLQQGLDLLANLDVVGHLLGKLRKAAIDEYQLGVRHLDLCLLQFVAGGQVQRCRCREVAGAKECLDVWDTGVVVEVGTTEAGRRPERKTGGGGVLEIR